MRPSPLYKERSIIQMDSKSIGRETAFCWNFFHLCLIYPFLFLVRFRLVIIPLNKFMVDYVSNQKPITKNTQNNLGLTKN